MSKPRTTGSGKYEKRVATFSKLSPVTAAVAYPCEEYALVAGDVDILLAPGLEAGNMPAKQLSFLAIAGSASLASATAAVRMVYLRHGQMGVSG